MRLILLLLSLLIASWASVANSDTGSSVAQTVLGDNRQRISGYGFCHGRYNDDSSDGYDDNKVYYRKKHQHHYKKGHYDYDEGRKNNYKCNRCGRLLVSTLYLIQVPPEFPAVGCVKPYVRKDRDHYGCEEYIVTCAANQPKNAGVIMLNQGNNKILGRQWNSVEVRLHCNESRCNLRPSTFKVSWETTSGEIVNDVYCISDARRTDPGLLYSQLYSAIINKNATNANLLLTQIDGLDVIQYSDGTKSVSVNVDTTDSLPAQGTRIGTTL